MDITLQYYEPLDMLQIIETIWKVWLPIFFSGYILYYVWKYLNKKYFTDKLEKIDLKKHDLFVKLDYIIYNDIQNIDLWDKKKNDVLQDLLSIKVYIWKKVIKEVIFNLNDDVDLLSSSEIYNLFMEVLREWVEKSDIAWKKIGIPEFVIDQFNKRHQPSITRMKWVIERISHRGLYRNKTKLDFILEMFISAFEGTMQDAKFAFLELNGQLTKTKYEKQIVNLRDDLKKNFITLLYEDDKNTEMINLFTCYWSTMWFIWLLLFARV